MISKFRTHTLTVGVVSMHAKKFASSVTAQTRLSVFRPEIIPGRPTMPEKCHNFHPNEACSKKVIKNAAHSENYD